MESEEVIPSLGSSLGNVPRDFMTSWIWPDKRLQQTRKSEVVLTTESVSLSSDVEGGGEERMVQVEEWWMR